MYKSGLKLIAASFFILSLMTASPLAAEVLVQVMSGQDEAAAQKEADRLFDLGVPAFSRAEEVPDLGTWNRVYIGPFETETDARAAANILKDQGTIKDFLVKTPPAAPSEARAEEAPGAGRPVTVVGGTEGDIPVIIDMVPAGEGQPVVAEPPLPVAQTPTYGEPVSPEQARELGLAAPPYGPPAPVSDPPEAALAVDEPAAQPYPAEPQTARPVEPPVSTRVPPATVLTGPDGRLPTYGEVELKRAERGLPEEFKPGDDMPGLIPAGPTPAPAPSSEAAVPGGSSAAPALAPSAGEGDGPLLMAQAGGLGSAGRSGAYSVQKLDGFTVLVDLSSSMRRLSNCQGKIKEEAVAALLRKMNRRIPRHPYNASLRVFGYKMAITKRDFTTLYYGPATYDREAFEDSVARLVAADSVSPFATAINEADNELQAMGNPKAVLMFADFEESIGSGAPVQSAARAKRRYGSDLSIYTFYITRQTEAVKLAKEIARAGGGSAFEICSVLNDEAAFENMMLEIFGPGDTVPCPDQDGDGVCDEDDICPNTPRGAPVDQRGCWIAAYSQFFDFDKAVVKSAFLPRIKHAAEIMVKNPDLPTVVIAGHTDNIGRPDYNLDLGRRRAKAVHDLMVEYGVPASRLSVETFGATRPVADNDTEEGRARNRRVEFHIGEVPPERN